MESDTRSGRGDVAAAVDCGGNGARLGRRRVGSDRRRARPIDICEGRSLAAAEASVLRRATFSAMRGEQQPGLACQLRTIYSECVVCREKKTLRVVARPKMAGPLLAQPRLAVGRYK